MPGPIVVVGSINMDLVVQSPRHPRPGETLLGGPFVTAPGGKGANQAVAAARTGGRVVMVGCVGPDSFGAQLRDGMSAAGIDTSRVRTVDAATGVALITVSGSGENTIVVASGANMAVTPEMVATAEEVVAQAAALVLQLEIPLETTTAAAALAHRYGIPVILNPAPAQALPGELLKHVTYLIPNEHEAGLLAGMAVEGRADAEAAAASLHDCGVAHIIVTLGSQGALLYGDEQTLVVPSFPIVPVDTTAAGDAFVGAFAVALSEGRAPAEAVSWGCAAGALTCTALGAQPSLPRRAAIEQLLAQGAGA